MGLRLIPSSQFTRTLLTRTYSNPTTPSSSLNFKQVALGGLAAGAGIAAYNFLGGSPSETNQIKPQTSKAPMASALSPKEWRNFKLKQVIPYNYNTSTFVFELPKGTDSGLNVASCLVTQSVAKEGPMACKEDNGNAAIRPYTPITPPDQQETLHLMVKQYPEGKMSKHIFSLKPGDELAMKGPFPKWSYKPNEFKAVGMIAGGTGITPNWQVIQKIASNPEDKTKVVLLFANNKEEDILLREEFERLAKQKPEQFSIHFVLQDAPKNWPRDLTGYLTLDFLKAKLPSPSLGSEVKIFVCGPPGQVAAVAGPKDNKEQGELNGMLKELGFRQDQVYKF